MEENKINEGNIEQSNNVSYVINKSERANSYEFGKAGNRFKLYFEDATDLFFQIDNLKKLGLYSEDEQPKQN